MNASISSHRDLDVWQKGMDFATEVYRLTKLMPKSEEYRLISQVVRAAASIPANIAEGNASGPRKQYAQHVSIARGSLAEAETFLLLAVRTGMLRNEEAGSALALAGTLGRQLNDLRRRLTTALEAPISAIPNP